MDEKEFQELMRYQNMVSRQVVQEARIDKKIKLVGVINHLTGYGKKKVQTAAVIHEAELHGFTEQETYELLDDLVKDNIFEEKNSYVQKI